MFLDLLVNKDSENNSELKVNLMFFGRKQL